MALLVFLFIVVPLVELYVIIQVGQAIGAGSLLMRSQGRAAWRRFQAALAEARVPGREVLDGVLVIFGGAFLLTPGFVTDVLGAVLLVPPTRALVRRVLVRRFVPAMVVRRAGTWPPADVEGTAVEVEPKRLP